MPVTANKLQQFAERLELCDADLSAANAATQILVKHLKKHLSLCLEEKWPIHRVIQGGSICKGTAIRTKFDVDLVLLMDMGIKMYMEQRDKGALKDGLLTCLEKHSDIRVDESSLSNKYPSLSCRLRNVDFDIFVGISLVKRTAWLRLDGVRVISPGEEQLRSAQRLILGKKDYSTAITAANHLSSSCVERINEVLMKETPVVKQVIMLVKQWRSSCGLTNFQSFAAEMVVLNAVHRLRMTKKTPVDHKSLFVRSLQILTLEDLVATHPRILRYGHLNMYVTKEWSSWVLHQYGQKRLLITNPMMPNLDVIYSVPPSSLWQWSEAASAALWHADNNSSEVLQLFGDVFGDGPPRKSRLSTSAKLYRAEECNRAVEPAGPEKCGNTRVCDKIEECEACNAVEACTNDGCDTEGDREKVDMPDSVSTSTAESVLQ